MSRSAAGSAARRSSGTVIRDFLPEADLIPYVESILQVYNARGRRDNKYKARIKITLREAGPDAFRQSVEERFRIQREAFSGVDRSLLADIRAMFPEPDYKEAPVAAFESGSGERSRVSRLRGYQSPPAQESRLRDRLHLAQGAWRYPGRRDGGPDALIADLAERYGHDEIRISHEQNCILPHVHRGDVPAVRRALRQGGLATANVGLASDMIACPGMDYCALATARSIPVAQGIARRIQELGTEREVGELKIKISGCVNACGHHHVGHIGILGLERAGAESYQITLGGDGTETAAIGERTGPGFSAGEIVGAVERVIGTYLELRSDEGEAFLATYRRIGMEPFKAALYSEGAWGGGPDP